MSAKDEAEFESEAQLVESSVSFENMIKPNDEFLKIFKSIYTFSKNQSQFSKKQINIMEATLDKLFNEIINSKDTKLDNVITLAYSYQIFCHAYIELGQKKVLYLAKKVIMHCLYLIKDKELDKKFILLALKSYDNLGYIYHKQKRTEKAIEIYSKAVEFYLTYTRKGKQYGSPIDFKDIINKSSAKLNGFQKLQNMYIFILQSLIELYTLMLPTNNQSLMLCNHLLLVAEFDKLFESKECLKWIKRAMTLCDYLLKYDCFTEAKSYLTTATSVGENFITAKSSESIGDSRKLVKTIRKQEMSLKVFECNEQENIITTLLNLHWIRYGVMVLRKSAKRLLWLEKGEDSETNELKFVYSTKSLELASQKLLFFYKIKEVYSIPNMYELSKEYVSNYNEANKVFSRVLQYAYFSRNYFSSKKDIEIYARFLLDICNAHRYMALYEKNITDRILLQHQSIFILSSATHIMSSKSNILMNIRLQLVIVYLSLMEIKFEQLETVHALYTPQKYDIIKHEIREILELALINLGLYLEVL